MSLLHSFTFMGCRIREIHIRPKDKTVWSQNWIVKIGYCLLLSIISISSKPLPAQPMSTVLSQ